MGRDEWLTVYDDGLGASWQPRENFFDENGDVNEVFQDFETKAPNDARPKTPLKRPLSPASKAIYNHTALLSDQSIGSSEVGSADEMANINIKIKEETKKERFGNQLSAEEKKTRIKLQVVSRLN